MAFTMRQPMKLTSALAVTTKTFSRTPLRSFHSRPNFFTSRTNTPITVLSKTRNAFRRAYQQPAYVPTQNTSTLSKALVAGGVMGGTWLAVNMMFNRETREDGGMPAFERAYLNDTFMHTGLGIGIIGLSSRVMFQSGLMYRMMATNPMILMIGGLGLSMGSMMVTRATSPENYVQKYAAWTSFNAVQGLLIAPLLFMTPPAILGRAGLYTIAMMGTLSFVGATAKQEKYLYLGGPLLAGLAVVVASSFAPMVLPATAVRTLAITENLSLYGGLAVFGGFTLYDVQKILHHARMAEQGLIAKDAVNESMSLELDFLNIFIRMVQILMSQQRK